MRPYAGRSSFGPSRVITTIFLTLMCRVTLKGFGGSWDSWSRRTDIPEGLAILRLAIHAARPLWIWKGGGCTSSVIS